MKKLLPILMITILTTVGAAFMFDTETVVITGNTSTVENMPGWYFARDAANTVPYTFTNDEASLGSGSLYVPPISSDPARKFIGEYFEILHLDDFESFSYDFMMGASGTPEQYYLNVYVNFAASNNDFKFYDCRYNVVPANGSDVGFTTVSFDVNGSYPVTTRNTSPFPCPSTPADMGSDANIRAFAINLGDTNASDAGMDGFFDNVVLVRGSGTTIFDFESDADGDGVLDGDDNCPGTAPGVVVGDTGCPLAVNKDACKNNGWKNLYRQNGSAFKNQGDCIQYVNTGK